MNHVICFVRRRSSTNRRAARVWLLVGGVLGLLLLAACAPVQRPAAAAPAAAAASTAAPITLHIAIPEPQGRSITPFALEFVDQVKTLSNGSIIIEPVWDVGAGTPSGNEKGLIQTVIAGNPELGVVPSRAWDGQHITSLHVLQAPFLITNDALAAAVATSEVGTRLLDSLSPAGVVGLTMWPADLRHPFSEMPDKPLLAPQDFAGKVIRAGTSDITQQLIKLLGATRTSEDSGYQGAESGLLNGYTLNGKPTVTGNVTFYPRFDILFANAAAFAALSDEQRTLLRQAAAAAQTKAIAEHPKEADTAAAWCADGGTIVLASPEQLAAFEQVAQPIFDQIEQDPANAALIAMIRELKANIPPSPGATACTPVVTSPKPAPSVDGQVWSEGLPPNGTWQVKLTTEDFLRMGMVQSSAAHSAGMYTMAFQDGTFQGHWQSEQGETVTCAATYAVAQNYVRFTYVPTQECPAGFDDIQWRRDDDGLYLHLFDTAKGAPQLGERAYLEAKPWQMVEPAATSTSGSATTPDSLQATTDATLARLRLANWVYGSRATDMYVDGQIAVLGSKQRELTNVAVGFMTGFLYLEPGLHHVAVVPSGKGLDEAMIALDVNLEVGHRYTVGVMGQTEDDHFSPLVIDETTALAKAGDSSVQNMMIYVNNMAGVDTVDFLEDGVGPRNVPYGGFVAAPIKAGHVDHLVVTVNGSEKLADNPGNFGETPSGGFIHANGGHFPAGPTKVYDSDNWSDLNAREKLTQFDDVSVVWNEGDKLSFHTFLAAIEKAGLNDLLTTGTYLIFAPTDAAFAAMPKEQLAALMADPKALADFLRYHIVEGYYPPGTLSGAMFGVADSTVTDLQGADLKLQGDLSINGINMPGLPNMTVVNGTRIIPVTKVLVPPAS